MRFMIAAGGTGGHLFPGMAVGEVLIARGHEVMLLVSEKDIDAVATKGVTGFRIEKVAGIGMPKLLSPAMFAFGLRFWRALRHVKRLVREFQPAAVLGMGGFTSTAPILAGKAAKLPTFVHESNAIPGRANRLNARFVDKVLLGFQEAAPFFTKTSCQLTGTPIRQGFISPIEKTLARTALNLKPQTPTVLIVGGSQGAHGINSAIENALPNLAKRDLQFIHLAGRQDEEALKSAYERLGITSYVAAFHSRMQEVYSASDFVVARSGAATLAELSSLGLPSLLIPYPFAADDHQTANAKIFERAGAAFRLQEDSLAPGAIEEKLFSVLDHPSTLQEMAQRCRALTSGNAAEKVADFLLNASAQ